METIEIDCTPGNPRPGDLIDGVLEGTGLTAGETIARCFGLWVWQFDVERDEWEKRVQPIVEPRLKALYERGLVRYASW